MIELNYNLDKLTQAIIIQSCNDLFTCKRMIDKRNKNTANRIGDCRKLMQECLDFFNSKYYDTLINGNEDLRGDKVIERIYQMVEDEDRYPGDYNPFKQRDTTEEDS